MLDEAIAVSRQCKLLAITRSVIYAHKKRQQDAVDEDEGLLLQLLDEEYTRHPFYGTRRMTQYLRGLGHVINRKRVQRLMRKLGLAGMAPGPNTSKRHPQHTLYPTLLRGVEVIAPNQVWSTDITYIRLRHGFVYLVLVQPQGAGMAVIEHNRCRVLCGLLGGSHQELWHAKNLQHRSRVAVHQRQLHGGADSKGHHH
jgi:hypothetical protein